MSMPKLANFMFACFHLIMPYALSRRTICVMFCFRRTAVSISCEFIMNPPSPETATTLRSGCTIFAAIAEGRPAPIVASALSSSMVFGWRQR